MPYDKTDPGHVTITDTDDEEYPYYWHAFIGDTRVNGGICKERSDGFKLGQDAIWTRRRALFYETHFWDEETADWYPNGTIVDLPCGKSCNRAY